MIDIQNISGLSDSRFYMWRAVFAMAHADGVVSPQEVAFLSESTHELNLSEEQRIILRNDLIEEQKPSDMFARITDAKDLEEFFVLARVLCWSDGNFDDQERKMVSILSMLRDKREAEILLAHSKQVVEEIRLNKDQWVEDHPEEKSIFEFFGAFVKKAS